MERRFVLFIVLAALILMVNTLLSALFFPRQPVPEKDKAALAQAKDQAAGAKKRPKPQAAAEKPAEMPADDQDQAGPSDAAPADNASPDAAAADDAADEEVPPGAAQPQAAPQAKPSTERVSLGSYDPASGYRLLVTLCSAGAAVERVELNNPRYREQEDRSGYIGHLAPADAPHAGGCILQVVGRGTPAAQAGLEVGDVIQQLGSKRITSASDFEAALKETEAGDQVTLAAERKDKPFKFKIELGRRPLEIIRPEFDSKPLDVVADEHDPLSMLMTIEQAGRRRLVKDEQELKGVDLLNGNWEIVRATIDEAVLQRRLDKLGLEITKRYHLAKAEAPDENPDSPDYNLLLDLQIRNISDKPQDVAYRLDGPTGLPLEGAWYATKISQGGMFSTAGMRDVMVRFNGSKNEVDQASCAQIVDAKEGKAIHWSESEGPLDFVAVDTQYFASAVLPRKQEPSDLWFEDIRPIRVGNVPADKTEKKLTDVSFRMISKPFPLAPGAAIEHEYEIFAGPKKPALLDQYVNGDANLGELVYYGWFGWVAKPMLALLHTFYRLVHNYGIAIVMLTVLVRGCMFPLSRKQALSAQKMQELRPEIQKITEKYKKPEDRTRAQQELFRKHNYNPFGGCLLVFVQLPIFVGLYRSLMVDVELRQAPLISESIRWASNLAAPDMLWDWSHVMPAFVIGYLGPYLNVFPLVTIGLMIWQQKMFMPPPADEQAAMQQKMMSYMMIFMGVMFFKVACGLCLYFIASSLWGITERKLLPKPPAPGQSGDTFAQAAATARGDGSNGAAGGKKRQRGRK